MFFLGECGTSSEAILTYSCASRDEFSVGDCGDRVGEGGVAALGS